MTTKMISFRAWPEVQAFLDDFCYRNGVKKSWVINTLINHLVSCADEKSVATIINTRFPYEKGFRITFEVDKELMRQRLSSVVTDL